MLHIQLRIEFWLSKPLSLMNFRYIIHFSLCKKRKPYKIFYEYLNKKTNTKMKKKKNEIKNSFCLFVEECLNIKSISLISLAKEHIPTTV